MALMLWQMSQFTLDVSDQEIMLNGLIQGIGMGLVFVPLTMVTFATLKQRFRTEGSSMFALIRNLGISIGVSGGATLLERNMQINHAELAAHITPFNRALQFLAPTLTTQSPQGVMTLRRLIDRQAGMIAYNDLFRLSLYLMIGAALPVPFMRMPGKNAAPDKTVLVEA